MVDPFIFVLRFLFDFWWLFLPFFTWQIFWERFVSDKKITYRQRMSWSFFEIKFPSGILRNPKAMEEVFNSLHAIAPDTEYDLSWYSLNIKGFFPRSYTIIFILHNGKLNFYMRYPSELKEFIKTRFYSHYPEIQFVDVENPLAIFPPNIPNSLFEVEIFDVRPKKEDAYPIKTYSSLEYLPKEQQIDPITVFSEGAYSFSDKEWLIFQLGILPTTPDNSEYGKKWIDRGNKIINKLIGKEEKKEIGPKDEIMEFINNLLLAPFRTPVWTKSEEKTDKEFNLQKLTPGERKTIEAIQNKLSKLGFWCYFRIAYFAYSDIFQQKRFSVVALINSVLRSFSTEDLNGFSIYPLTFTPVVISRERIFNIKRRESFFFKIYRTLPLPKVYVNSLKKYGLDKGFILNSEELASIFHPPMEFVPPTGIEKIPTRELPPSPQLPFLD